MITATRRIGEVSQLDLVVITGHSRLEADVGGHVVECELLGILRVAIVLLQLLERTERLHIRGIVVGEVAPIVLRGLILRLRVLLAVLAI